MDFFFKIVFYMAGRHSILGGYQWDEVYIKHIMSFILTK